jgi:cbb3-type cytochrome oxidase maturation protein
MAVIVILIVTSVLVAGGFLAAFIWAVRSGQYDDTTTPAHRILFDETPSETRTHEENS